FFVRRSYISVIYSFLTRRSSDLLSELAYNFMVMMKKNSEQLGSVFDPQPSQLAGNMSCITDPEEMVIGFIEVAEEKAKRIFIKRDRKSTRLNSSHVKISYAVFCL